MEDTLTRLCMVYGFAQADVLPSVQHRADGAHTGGAPTHTNAAHPRAGYGPGPCGTVNALAQTVRRPAAAGKIPAGGGGGEYAMPRLTRTPPSAPCTPLSQRRSPSFSAARYATLRRRPFRACCCSARCAFASGCGSTVFCRVCWPARWQHWPSC